MKTHNVCHLLELKVGKAFIKLQKSYGLLLCHFNGTVKKFFCSFCRRWSPVYNGCAGKERKQVILTGWVHDDSFFIFGRNIPWNGRTEKKILLKREPWLELYGCDLGIEFLSCDWTESWGHKETQGGGAGGLRKSPLAQASVINSGKIHHSRLLATHSSSKRHAPTPSSTSIYLFASSEVACYICTAD